MTTPFNFSFPNRPAPNARDLIVMTSAATFDANFPGSRAACAKAPTGAVRFAIQKIAGSQQSSLGVVLFEAGQTFGVCSGAGGSLLPGDILAVQAPASRDKTLSDVAMTVLAETQ